MRNKNDNGISDGMKILFIAVIVLILVAFNAFYIWIQVTAPMTDIFDHIFLTLVQLIISGDLILMGYIIYD